MKVSGYLERILFRDLTPAVAQLFEERSSQLFEASDQQSFVEILVQQPARLTGERNEDESFQESSSCENPQQRSLEPEVNLSFPSLSPVDGLPSDLPHLGSSRLGCSRISCSQELSQFSTVRG